MFKPHYFAYGSNMNPARVAERGLLASEPRRARLPNFRLRFNKRNVREPGLGHANVVYEQGHDVEGVLYTLAGPDEILKMDPFERAPINYGRDCVLVYPDDEPPVWTWIYYANRALQEDGLVPPLTYLEHLLAGEAFLSASYVEFLRSFKAVARG